MKFLAVLVSFLAAVSAADQRAYIHSLMKGAQPTAKSQLFPRKLENNYQVNIANYNVKFYKCQFVKAYDQELAEDEDSQTVLNTKRFVIFRLCPGDCSTCNYNFGEYLIDLETYLVATVEYFQDYQEEMCQDCQEACQNNNNNNNNNGGRFLEQAQQNYYNIDCNSCVDECEKIENMQDNGYYEASQFRECQMVYDPEDDNKAARYAGPVCASNGSKIKIGVFYDEDCLMPDNNNVVDDFLQDENGNQLKLSHALLKKTYTNTCISCREPQDAADNDQGNDNVDEDEVIEMCEQLYDGAAKCETKHGFDDGSGQYYAYENQAQNEEVVCDFMYSLESDTYTEAGEINVYGADLSRKGSDSTTKGQKFALTFFILGTLGLAIYAAMLHSKLVKGGKADLSSSGGAMA